MASLLRGDKHRLLYGVVFSVAVVLTGLSAAWSTIAMPITPYDTVVYLLLPSAAALMTIRWAHGAGEWSWPVLVTHQVVLSALYFALYLGLWVVLWIAAWGGFYLLIGLVSLPLVILAGRYLRDRRLGPRGANNAQRAVRTGLGMSCLAYAAFAAYQLQAIFRSESETAVTDGLWDFLLIAPIVVLGSFAVASGVAFIALSATERSVQP